MGIEHLLTASPQVEAIKAEPYSVDEIDQLLNAARVWATVVALRDHMRGDADEDKGDTTANVKKIKTKVVEVRQAWEALTRELTKANGEAVTDVLVELEELIETILEDE